MKIQRPKFRALAVSQSEFTLMKGQLKYVESITGDRWADTGGGRECRNSKPAKQIENDCFHSLMLVQSLHEELEG